MDTSTRLGIAFFACKRTYLAALSLAFYYRYQYPDSEIHAFVDKPKDQPTPPRLLAMLDALHGGGYLQSLNVQETNNGLTAMITGGMTQLGESGDYDFVARMEDDILIGPECLHHMLTVLQRSAKEHQQPVGLLSGQVAPQPHRTLAPLRFRNLDPYVLGIHGHNTVEGLTILNTEMAAKGFTYALEDPKAYNVQWLNKARTAGYEGASVVRPVITLQHVGYRTTVPLGTPITPAVDFYSKVPIKMPFFDWNEYRNMRTEPAEEIYVGKCVRAIAAELPPDLAERLIEMFHDVPPDYLPPKVSYTSPYAKQDTASRTARPPQSVKEFPRRAVPVKKKKQTPAPAAPPAPTRVEFHRDSRGNVSSSPASAENFGT